MEILRSNFDTSIPYLLESIRSCDFIAIDTEFTGLSSAPEDQTTQYDTLEMRYQKIRRGCTKFWACQLGISTFTHESGGIKARPFNIYLLPHNKDQLLTCNVGSMSFLSQHNFNFGTWFTEGLYCVRAEELLKVVEDVQSPEQPSEIFRMSHFHSEFLSKIKDELLEFAQHPNKSKDINLRTPYLLKLFFSKGGLASKFRGFSFKSLKNPSGSDTTLIRVTKAKKKHETVFVEQTSPLLDWASETESCARLSLATAGSIIVSALIQAKKPIVGHHFSLDLGFIVNQFVCELPATYREYKEILSGVFPMIFDTKYIASQSILKDQFGPSNLERITHILTKDPQYQSLPNVTVNEDVRFRRYHSGAQAHEAGYDAYITGFDFACMGYMLLLHTPDKSELTPSNFWLALKPFENKIYLSNHYKHCMDLMIKDDEDEIRDVRFKYVLIVETDMDIESLATSLSTYGDIRIVRKSSHDFFVRLEQLNPEIESLDEVVSAAQRDLGLIVRKMAE